MDPSAPLLVVDDDEDDLNLTRGILRKAGGVDNIVGFVDGEELVAHLKAPDCPRPLGLVLDIKMPGLTGLDVLAWLRGHPSYESLPVAMWSSSDDPRDISRARELGAQCYFGKYPPVDSVRAMLEAMLTFPANDHAKPTVFRVTGNLLA